MVVSLAGQTLPGRRGLRCSPSSQLPSVAERSPGLGVSAGLRVKKGLLALELWCWLREESPFRPVYTRHSTEGRTAPVPCTSEGRDAQEEGIPSS